MLFASVIPLILTLPASARDSRISHFSFVSMNAPAPVTVFWAVGVRNEPYSSGYLNCRSEEQKCDDASVIALSANPPETNAPPMSIPSAAVEQAPYSPRYGIGKSAAVKPVAVH